MDYHFDPQGLCPDDIRRRMTDAWAGLPFDADALAALKRDGLSLEQLRLGGANPYNVSRTRDANIMVRVADGPAAQPLIDLFQLHFLRRLRDRPSRD